MEIRWSDAARGDVRRLRQYIAQDSPFYAKRFCEQLIGAVDKLAEFRRMGILEPGPFTLHEFAARGHKIDVLGTGCHIRGSLLANQRKGMHSKSGTVQ